MFDVKTVHVQHAVCSLFRPISVTLTYKYNTKYTSYYNLFYQVRG